MNQEIALFKRLVTSRQAAQMLSISERTLWSLSNSGQLPVVRIGRAVRYAVSDIEAYIERSRCS
jgi:excisionase family DNA binding protein